MDPARHVQDQQDQSQHSDHAHRRAPAHPELARIFIGPACEIDFQTHYAIKAPTTPAILHLGTGPPAEVPSCAEEINSCTSAPVDARRAEMAPLDSGSPAT